MPTDLPALDDLDNLQPGPRGAFTNGGWDYTTKIHAGNLVLSRQRLEQVHPFPKYGPMEGPAFLLARGDEWVLLDSHDTILGRGPDWKDAIRTWR